MINVRLIVFLFIGILLIACTSEVTPTATSDDTAVTSPPAGNTPTEPSVPEPSATPVPTLAPTAEPTIEPTQAMTQTLEPSPDESGGTPSVTPTGELQSGDTGAVPARVSEADGMLQIFIPPGEFLMGSVDPEAKTTVDGGRSYPEVPQFTYTLDGYWIDQYEVSNSQYALCVEAGVCIPPYKTSSETRQSYYGNPEFADYPVIWVKWGMARTYCEWAGRQLPTEAEWEKAARGPDGNKYPWGDDPIDGTRANFCDVDCPRTIANGIFNDGFPDTSPVGNYPAGASPYGVLDMSGNVWEWTTTIPQPYPYNPDDGRENLEKYAERIWRGGPWSNGYWYMRSSVRYRSFPDYWYVNLGFRCMSPE